MTDRRMSALPFVPQEQPAALGLRLPSHLGFVAVARTAGRILVHALPEGGELWSRVELPLVEAVTNAIRHANGEDPRLPVEIELGWNHPELVIRVSDRGDAFVLPAFATDQPPAVENTSGRGLFLMRTMSDDLQVERMDTGNIVTLTWRVSSLKDE